MDDHGQITKLNIKHMNNLIQTVKNSFESEEPQTQYIEKVIKHGQTTKLNIKHQDVENIDQSSIGTQPANIQIKNSNSELITKNLQAYETRSTQYGNGKEAQISIGTQPANIQIKNSNIELITKTLQAYETMSTHV
jgi:hypothetical protein